MDKFGVELGLEKVRDAETAWKTAKRDFDKKKHAILKRLLHEALANRMSVTNIADSLGWERHRVRLWLKGFGMYDPKASTTVLAETAAKALHDNAELMGVDVAAIDLMSPLAYLPAGDALRREATPVSRVTEILPITTEMLRDAYTRGWDDRSKHVDYAPNTAVVEITDAAWSK